MKHTLNYRKNSELDNFDLDKAAYISRGETVTVAIFEFENETAEYIFLTDERYEQRVRAFGHTVELSNNG